jgi:hypothetical protein
MTRALIVLTLALAVAAAPAAAQQRPSRACRIHVDSVGREARFITMTDGTQQVFAGGGVFARCLEEPTTITADSMAYFEARGELRFIGSVHFRDSTAQLDADRATYWLRQERLVAVGNVYTLSLVNRSDLRGPNLDYLRAAAGLRDTSELVATSRPTIRFFPSRRDTAASDPDSAEPFVTVGDRVRMRGNDRMWASGRVTIDRSDLSARGDSAWLDLVADEGMLLRNPQIQTTGENRYRLTGDRIRFFLTPEHDVRRVIAMIQSDAVGPDWHLHADTLDLTVDSGRVTRAQAWGTIERAFAESEASTILADSLDIQMPEQVVSRVEAFGHARATSRSDSLAPEEDWLTGDTLYADFERADSAGRLRSELSRLTALGSARAYYLVQSRDDPSGPRGISYSRGRRIEIAMRDSRVSVVDVVGLVDGIYLEPLPPPRDTGAAADSAADTTVADTLGAPAPRDTSAVTRDTSATGVPRGVPTAPRTPAAPLDTARVRPRLPPSPRPRPQRPPPGYPMP